ncbi:SPI-1 type III secretion system chaperone SpaK [Yersinia nurmii]|uniref:SPI-1 type III secretion system chaperone SpaK n=1 Tax=Yersinia nurmii TaxID=685706 RepID=A0AAW7JYR2_9GAMM|nr:SPI-1 type III secretion system chaperone SpaK [Yersinia nurmii]MDN0086140.1 SPI-1 type III secretion system chaperone SpaK [Yersinia nurmii]
MNVDIVTLIRDTLLETGCDESLLNNFDGHSTISLDFSDRASMLISLVDDQVWLWSRIGEENTHVLSQKADDLLKTLMEGCAFTPSGQLQLATNDGYIELKGLVNSSYTETSTRFAEALDEFFALQEKFVEILQ